MSSKFIVAPFFAEYRTLLSRSNDAVHNKMQRKHR